MYTTPMYTTDKKILQLFQQQQQKENIKFEM